MAAIDDKLDALIQSLERQATGLEQIAAGLAAQVAAKAADKEGKEREKAEREKAKAEKETVAQVRGFGGAISDVAGRLGGGITSGLTAMMAPLTKLPGQLGAVASVVMEVIDLGPKIVSAALPYVKAFNPALVYQFNLALENVQASIGSFLGPIIDAAKGFADQFNVLFTSLAPVIRPAIQGIVDAIKPLIAGLIPVIDALVRIDVGNIKAVLPIIRVIIDSFVLNVRSMVPVLQLFAIPLRLAALALMPFVELLRLANAVMAPFIEPLTAMTDLIGDILDAASALPGLFDVLVDPLMFLADTAKQVADQLTRFINAIREFLGIPRAPAGRGMTQAARDVQMISAEDIGKQARLAAVGMGRQPIEVAEEQLNVMGLIHEKLDALVAYWSNPVNILTALGAIPTNMLTGIGTNLGDWALKWRNAIVAAAGGSFGIKPGDTTKIGMFGQEIQVWPPPGF